MQAPFRQLYVYIQMDIYIFVNSAAERSPFTLTGVTRLVLIMNLLFTACDHVCSYVHVS